MVKKNLLRFIIVLSTGSYLQLASAGCGSGGVNRLAQIPNLAPTPPSTIISTPAAVTPDNVNAATAISAPTPPPQVGKVVWVKGSMQAIGPDKKVRNLTHDAVIFQHDVLVTPKGSQAQVVFSDHTLMTLSESTKLYVNKYEYDNTVKKGSVGKSILDLIEGGFRTITGSIAKSNPPDYRVNTEVATIGVRGTDYAANIQACKLVMQNNKGTPVVSNEKGTLVLTAQTPYASVTTNQAPITIKTQPEVFKVPLPIVTATFVPPVVNTTDTSIKTQRIDVNEQKSIDSDAAGAGGGGGGGKNCGPAIPTSTGNFNVKFNQ